jgi:hypothetical protein
VAALFLAWQWASIALHRSFVFDIYKESGVITAGALLSFILAIASYLKPFRRRTLSHVAITVAGLALASAVLVVPL